MVRLLSAGREVFYELLRLLLQGRREASTDVLEGSQQQVVRVAASKLRQRFHGLQAHVGLAVGPLAELQKGRQCLSVRTAGKKLNQDQLLVGQAAYPQPFDEHGLGLSSTYFEEGLVEISQAEGARGVKITEVSPTGCFG